MSPTNPDLIAYFSNGNICVHDVTTNSDAKLTDLTDDDGKFLKFRFSKMIKKKLTKDVDMDKLEEFWEKVPHSLNFHKKFPHPSIKD